MPRETSNQTRNITLIEQPRASPLLLRGDAGLAGISRLSRNELKQLTAVSRKTAREVLDMTCKFCNQDPRRLERAERAIAEECPFTKKYEHCWPIRSYLIIYMNRNIGSGRARKVQELSQSSSVENTKNQLSRVAAPQDLTAPLRRQFVGRTPTKRQLRSSPSENSTRSCRAVPPPPPNLSSPIAQASRIKRKEQAFSLVQAPTPSLNSTLSRTLQSRMTSASSQASFSSISSISVSSMVLINEATKPVLCFLQELKPPLPELLPLFLSEGIINKEWLDAAATVSNPRNWLEPLVTSGKIKRLHGEVIWDGLAVLANKAQAPRRE